MTTASGAPDLGNIVDDFIDPIKKALGALVSKGEAAVAADAQTALNDVSSTLANLSSQVAAAQTTADGVINPIVNKGLTALAGAVSTAYPPFAPLVAAALPEVETLADDGTDAIALKILVAVSGWLSQAGKTAAAVQLSNLAGAS